MKVNVARDPQTVAPLAPTASHPKKQAEANDGGFRGKLHGYWVPVRTDCWSVPRSAENPDCGGDSGTENECKTTERWGEYGHCNHGSVQHE